MPKVTVIGSINMDLTVLTDRVPAQGETVLGEEFHTYPGGKGANQAVAAARAGADVTMIGAVGADAFGEELLKNLKEENIRTDLVSITSDASTGTATIILSENDNRIIVAPGANYSLTADMIKERKKVIETSDVVLMQLEIPLETVEAVISIAKDAGVPVLLNPAPYQRLPEEIVANVSWLTPNSSEYEQLLPALSGEENVVITRGEEGVDYKNENFPGYKVEVLDTTGAGDTFNGVLATLMAEGKDIREAILVANAASALSVTKKGAQNGMPTRNEVEAFLKKRRNPDSW